jgi:hypothetical protein
MQGDGDVGRGVLDKTRWAIVRNADMSDSGRDEILVRTVLKRVAEKILRDAVPDARTRRAYRVERLELDEADQTRAGQPRRAPGRLS